MYLADLVHLFFPLLDEEHAVLQAAQILEVTLTRLLLLLLVQFKLLEGGFNRNSKKNTDVWFVPQSPVGVLWS